MPFNVPVVAQPSNATSNIAVPDPTINPAAQVPSKPANLRATAGPTTNSVTLDWDDSVFAAGTTGRAYEVWEDQFEPDHLVTTITDSTRTSPTLAAATYRYYVVAVDSNGRSTPSDKLPVTVPIGPPVDTTAPSTPTNFNETHTSSTVTLTWTPSADNVGVTGYILTRNGTQIATPTTSPYTDSGLAPATPYTYTLAARDAAGNVSATVTRAATTSGTTPPPPTGPLFPRLSALNINGGPPTTTAYKQQVAKLDFVIWAMWRGWGDKSAFARSVKALNPNLLIGNYQIMTEVSTGDSAAADLRTKLQSAPGPNGTTGWYSVTANGQHTTPYPSTWGTNLTSFVRPDSNGDKWPQYLAKRDTAELFNFPECDIIFMDRIHAESPYSADWDRNGSNETITTQWRDGQRAYMDAVQALNPGKYLMGNSDTDFSGKIRPGGQNFNQYKQVMHGNEMEAVVGLSWSTETWGGFRTLMDWYQELYVNMLDPKLIMFDMRGDAGSDYKNFRYTFAACLLSDGYFCHDIGSNLIPWYDEYDLRGANRRWLGKPIDPPQYNTPWSQGVYMRRYEGGLALCNPKGNGAKTVTPPSGYRRISGTQNAAVNNGQLVTGTVNLADRDGLLLVKA